MFPQDNIFKIYYKIGRVLPFIVRRFPRGVVTEWYNSQSVVVTNISPRKDYGEAWGYYLKDEERADSNWCSKGDAEPQPIPCCGCGGWVLVKVIGEPTVKPDSNVNETNSRIPLNVLSAKDKMKFGKYKGKTIAEIRDEDLSYLEWADRTIQEFCVDWDSLK